MWYLSTVAPHRLGVCGQTGRHEMNCKLSALAAVISAAPIVGCGSDRPDFEENEAVMAGPSATQVVDMGAGGLGGQAGQGGAAGAGGQGGGEPTTSSETDSAESPTETDDHSSPTQTDTNVTTDPSTDVATDTMDVGPDGAATDVGPNGAATDVTPEPAPELSKRGEPCGEAAECETAHCVDGVCCETACAEECAQCDAPGQEGTCSEAQEEGCGEPQCAAPMKLCDGECVEGSVCCGGCGANTPVCSNGTCVQRSLGEECTGNAECSTGFCADGYCCNTACQGQCEACDATGTFGTCIPVTTPRTPCGGTGDCAGVCDGSAQNRASCVFPENTPCGNASCSNGTFTSAPQCDGAGSCAPGVMMSCEFGCDTQNGPNCLSSCPNSNENLCNGSCVDTESNPAACGAACQTCSGTRSECFEGECVECVSAADCPDSADMICNTDNECECGFGTHACSSTPGECWDDGDVENCGSECIDCSQDYASSACGVGNSCDNFCLNGRDIGCALVGGKPDCSYWGFETGVEGWEVEPQIQGQPARSASSLSTSTMYSTGGTTSLAVPVNNGGTTNRYANIRVRLCDVARAVDLRGKVIHWEIRADPPTSLSGLHSLIYYTNPELENGTYIGDHSANDTAAWEVEFFSPLESSSFSSVYGIGLHFSQAESYSGTYYIDNVYIE